MLDCQHCGLQSLGNFAIETMNTKLSKVLKKSVTFSHICTFKHFFWLNIYKQEEHCRLEELVKELKCYFARPVNSRQTATSKSVDISVQDVLSMAPNTNVTPPSPKITNKQKF